MEEEVLKMVNTVEWGMDSEDVARQITSMVMEFIEWLGFEKGTRLYFRDVDDTWMYLANNYDSVYKSMKTNELFDYWKNNIRKP